MLKELGNRLALVKRFLVLWVILVNIVVMNKGRRHELKMLKYKRRLNNFGLKETPNSNLTAYRSHGSPCSCFICSNDKYNRAKMKRDTILRFTDADTW